MQTTIGTRKWMPKGSPSIIHKPCLGELEAASGGSVLVSKDRVLRCFHTFNGIKPVGYYSKPS